MSPAAITALATLLAEAAALGISVSRILDEVEKTGQVPPEEWARIRQKAEQAEEAWRNA